MAVQLTLNVRLQDHATFNNFFLGKNSQLFNYLKNLIDGNEERFVYLWGPRGSGRSHLLQASCHAMSQQERRSIYLPLQEKLAPAILEDFETLDLICLDDVDCIVGQRDWEEAIFHCINAIQSTETRLIVAANAPPGQLPWSLPDLGSRLTAHVIFQIMPLDDQEKISALQLHANARGLQLTEEVGRYLLHHYPRDVHVLFNALNKLDDASLVAQRKLTIPFVKEVLG